MRAHLALTALFALLECSCSRDLLRRTPRPDPVQLRSAAASFTGDGRGEFRLVLAVANPKHSSGKLTGIDWELWLNNTWFASGTARLGDEIPPEGGIVEVKLPVAFGRMQTSSTPIAMQLTVRGNLTAQLEGSEEQLAFHGSSTVEAKGAPMLWRTETD